jgi:hypothetical protein
MGSSLLFPGTFDTQFAGGKKTAIAPSLRKTEASILRNIEYERQLDLDTRIRAQYQVNRGSVSRFTVQLEVLVEGHWQPVVRYDTSHRFAHCDLYQHRGQVIKTDLKMTFEEGLTYAINDLRDNWESYKNRFLER